MTSLFPKALKDGSPYGCSPLPRTRRLIRSARTSKKIAGAQITCFQTENEHEAIPVDGSGPGDTSRSGLAPVGGGSGKEPARRRGNKRRQDRRRTLCRQGADDRQELFAVRER